MGNLKAGFARIDITPPLGTTLEGYFETRYADGILDPLCATAVAFNDGEKSAVVISIDQIGLNKHFMKVIKEDIGKKTDLPEEAIFIHCTHIHTGPCIAGTPVKPGEWSNPAHAETLIKKVSDVAYLALSDLAPAEMSYTRGEAKNVSFVRCFKMKDGSTRTNPGRLDPNIDFPLDEPDNKSSLLIIKREGKPEIGIVNFQVHPDVVHGTKFSADFPYFVRSTYEKIIPNSLCMYINGSQGDSNHCDWFLPLDKCFDGYDRSRYMGRKIAMSVLADYELATPLSGEKISYMKKNLTVNYNKGTPEEVEAAREVAAIRAEKGIEAAKDYIAEKLAREGKKIDHFALVVPVGEATRLVRLESFPDTSEIPVTALSVGDVAFAGFPGEPFTEVGRSVKKNSPFELTITACCANGYEGYYPTEKVFNEGGYEAATAQYAKGTAEKIIECSGEILKELHNK